MNYLARCLNRRAFILKEPETLYSSNLSFLKGTAEQGGEMRRTGDMAAGITLGPPLPPSGGPWPTAGLVLGLVDWRGRPYRTSALFGALNALLWFVVLSPLRSVSLVCILTALLVSADKSWSSVTGVSLWCKMAVSWEMMHSGQESSGSLSQLHSLRRLLQETSAFKQQNPGKFCLLVCSLCTFFAVLGRYIPGIVISYALVLGIFLWPLVMSHDMGLWLAPVLEKLDVGLRNFLQKIRDNHEKRLSQAQTETQGIESDLSSMFPKLDSTMCKEMSVSDTEVSDVTWTDGTFNLSEGHTPLTENSEELDREEFTQHLPEFPSLDNGNTTNGTSDEDNLYPAVPAPHPAQPMAARHSTLADTEALSELADQFVSAVIQERIEAALGLTDSRLQLPQCIGALEESDSDVEDFELLDQSELEQFETELNLIEEKNQEQNKGQSHKQTATGFLSKLLRRQ